MSGYPWIPKAGSEMLCAGEAAIRDGVKPEEVGAAAAAAVLAADGSPGDAAKAAGSAAQRISEPAFDIRTFN